MQYGFKQGTEPAPSPSQVLFVSDAQRGTLSLQVGCNKANRACHSLCQKPPLRLSKFVQRTPGASGGPPSVAATPSPDVPAPGIRHDLHGRAPPRVPTSCRTIRRVLVDSPPGSANFGRRASSSSTDACACKPRPARTALLFGDSGGLLLPYPSSSVSYCAISTIGCHACGQLPAFLVFDFIKQVLPTFCCCRWRGCTHVSGEVAARPTALIQFCVAAC